MLLAGAAAVVLGACGTSSSVPPSTAAAPTTGGLAGVACPPAGATQTGTTALADGGTRTDYTTATGYQEVLTACRSAFTAAGWTVLGGGSSSADGAGGGGFGAVKAAARSQVDAGTGATTTTVHVCYWPTGTSDTTCGTTSRVQGGPRAQGSQGRTADRGCRGRRGASPNSQVEAAHWVYVPPRPPP